MKNILSSSEVFEAYARIDYSYFCLKEMYDLMGKVKPPIIRAVDEVTGYAKQEAEEAKRTAIALMEQIIEDKKIIGAETERDEEALGKIKLIVI
jgi:hypothetical protein